MPCFPHEKVITVYDGGRLGNNMGEYATLFGLSRRLNQGHVPLISKVGRFRQQVKHRSLRCDGNVSFSSCMGNSPRYSRASASPPPRPTVWRAIPIFWSAAELGIQTRLFFLKYVLCYQNSCTLRMKYLLNSARNGRCVPKRFQIGKWINVPFVYHEFRRELGREFRIKSQSVRTRLLENALACQWDTRNTLFWKHKSYGEGLIPISSILTPAKRFVEGLKASLGPNSSLVGVHIRRGDRVDAVADFEHGEMVDHEWFLHAMRTMALDIGAENVRHLPLSAWLRWWAWASLPFITDRVNPINPWIRAIHERPNWTSLSIAVRSVDRDSLTV